MKCSITVDLAVVSREILFHKLRCCLMKDFIPIDLIVALWVISASIDLVIVLKENFCFYRPDCCLMENSASMDLVVVLWKVSVPMDLIVVLWRNLFFFCYHRLDCCLMDIYIYFLP
jgi:hypothetical protein